MNRLLMRQTICRFSFVIAFIAAGTLAACSLYESQGRKALEANAIALSGNSLVQNFAGCKKHQASIDEELLSETEDAWIFQQTRWPLQIRVAVKNASELSCSFNFRSARELSLRLNSAILATVTASQSR